MVQQKQEFEQWLSDAADATERKGGPLLDKFTQESVDYFRTLGFSDEAIKALLHKKRLKS